jgi:hypothetical protein
VDDRTGGLEKQIRARGLPEAVVTIAVRGGADAHPALWYRAYAVSPSDDGLARTVIAGSARTDLVPLWTCETTTVFSAGDGSFLAWDAEEHAPSTTWRDFTETVRSLLTDLWEDEATDDELTDVAHLLLPPDAAARALVLEMR